MDCQRLSFNWNKCFCQSLRTLPIQIVGGQRDIQCRVSYSRAGIHLCLLFSLHFYVYLYYLRPLSVIQILQHPVNAHIFPCLNHLHYSHVLSNLSFIKHSQFFMLNFWLDYCSVVSPSVESLFFLLGVGKGRAFFLPCTRLSLTLLISRRAEVCTIPMSEGIVSW